MPRENTHHSLKLSFVTSGASCPPMLSLESPYCLRVRMIWVSCYCLHSTQRMGFRCMPSILCRKCTSFSVGPCLILGNAAGKRGRAGRDRRSCGQKLSAARWSTSISPISQVARNTSTGCVVVLRIGTRLDRAVQVERIMDLMIEANVEDNQFATKWSVTTGRPSNGMFITWVFCVARSHRTPTPRL